ncbi:rho GTPase-activating protein 7-like isoform X3 [Ostrea edulis]|uniref:rho GTPase-activating protein 7-like isoform X3 n=1 Tax=Ostrea edulis TaxID=37623 RepID=UPI0024AECF17|nr:rho GTPase-activating protein 7-like isoform X3 [Ostrea edulis]
MSIIGPILWTFPRKGRLCECKFFEFELQHSISESEDKNINNSARSLTDSAPVSPAFPPSVDRSEHIIQETLKEHKALNRSNTLPVLPQPHLKLRRSFSVTDNYSEEEPNFYIESSDKNQTKVIENSNVNLKNSLSPRHTRSLSTTAVQTSFDENSNPFEDTEVFSIYSSRVSQGTNTTDSLERPRKRNKSVGDVESKIPVKKPTDFPQKLIRGNRMGTFLHDQSPEMQVLVASTSPVLFRRKPSAKGRNRPRLPANEIYCNNAQNMVNNMDTIEMERELQRQEEMFLKKDMSQTWHGSTGNKWKKLYAPVVEQLTNGHIDNGYQTLPSKSSLLDEMHKKYCAYQYKNKHLSNATMNGTLPPKFQSSPPPPDRMKSRSWLLQHYTIPIPVSLASSPDSPDLKRKLGKPLKKNKTNGNEDVKQVASPSEERDVKNTSQEPKKQLDLRENVQMRRKVPIMNVQRTKSEEEIEAVEACRWLKEAGFPQYAQMYDECQFPVDISSVEKDHDFLDRDSMQPLVRRLSTLNKCAVMRIGTPSKKLGDESDDEDQCALSDKWKYQHNIRRWSRKDLSSPSSDGQPMSPTVKSSSSNDSLLTDQNSSSETGDSPILDSKMHHEKSVASDDYFGVKTLAPQDHLNPSTRALSPRLRRAASERIKGAKNFLKRMESFKSRKTRRIPRNGNVEISGPVVMDTDGMQAKIKHLNCKELSPSSEVPPSIPTEDKIVPTEPWSDSATNYNSDTSVSPQTSVSLQEISNPSSALNSTLKSLQDTSQSSTELHTSKKNSPSMLSGHTHLRKPNLAWKNISDSELFSSDTSPSVSFKLPDDHKPGTFPKVLSTGYVQPERGHDINSRTGSISLGSERKDETVISGASIKRRGSAGPRLDSHRVSVYDNVEPEEDLESAQEELDLILSKVFEDINVLNRAIYGEDAEILEPPTSSHNSTVNKSDDESHLSLKNLSALETDDSLNGNEDPDVTSRTNSSPDTSDHDITTGELSHDDSAENIEGRERRDSGVGSSLTRAPSDRRRQRIRWHSFQKSHRPSVSGRNTHISSLSVCQLMVLQKLSLCRLTGLIEKYSPNRSGWNWSMPGFMKRHKTPNYNDRNVFGVPLLVTLQRTAQPLPQCMLSAMRYLRKTAKDAVGIFRKSGVRTRIQKLKNEVEANPESVNFQELQAYDVADLLKQYFRELPECLLTNKLSEVFINIFIYLPSEQRLEALQSAVVLLPDENREVLQSLLFFLFDISTQADEHQMTASNLAVCFAPSLFNMSGTKSVTQSPSPRRPRKNLGVPDARELQEQKAAHECLTALIQECKKLFNIPTTMMSKCRFSYIEQGDPVSLEEFNKRSSEDDQLGYHNYMDTAIQGLLKESRDKFKGWVSLYSVPTNVDLSYKKVTDGHPLRLWRCSTEVEAPPYVALDRVKDERHIWDEDLIKWRSIEKLDSQTEVFQYTQSSMAPHPARDFCVLRSWRTDLPKGSCALVSTSIEHPQSELNGAIQGVVLASHFLIEPCGSGKSRVTHISRIDMRGRTPEWYKKVYSYNCVNQMERIRDSLKQSTDGPESTV